MRPEDESLLDDTALEFVRLFTESPDIPAGSLISEAERRQQALVDGSCRWSRRPGKRRCCGTSLVLDQRVAQEQQTGGRPRSSAGGPGRRDRAGRLITGAKRDATRHRRRR